MRRGTATARGTQGLGLLKGLSRRLHPSPFPSCFPGEDEDGARPRPSQVRTLPPRAGEFLQGRGGSSIEPLRSANSTVTCLRSPSKAADDVHSQGCDPCPTASTPRTAPS